MSIIIEGMKMPQHCIVCPFMVPRDNDDCILQSAEANSKFANWDDMKKGCPLVELPPHGRLIDADALPECDLYDPFWQEDGYSHAIIDNAQTIIPAEPGEEADHE